MLLSIEVRKGCKDREGEGCAWAINSAYLTKYDEKKGRYVSDNGKEKVEMNNHRVRWGVAPAVQGWIERGAVGK